MELKFTEISENRERCIAAITTYNYWFVGFNISKQSKQIKQREGYYLSEQHVILLKNNLKDTKFQ